MKRGFTLVELSIVLVIIGLLIGGILVAESMIQTVKIQRLIRDLQQYEIAINNFKTNYQYTPGDDPFFTPPGNGDNIFGIGAGGMICVGIYRNDEGYQAFTHLSQSGMLSKNYIVYQPDQCGGTHNSTYFDTSNADLIAPSTELDSRAAALWLGRKIPIALLQASSNYRLYFNFVTNASFVLPLETKLGYVPVGGSAAGISNSYGQGNCRSASATVSCNAATAVWGSLSLYMEQR